MGGCAVASFAGEWVVQAQGRFAMDEKRDASAGDPANEGKTAGGEAADESFAWTGSAGGPDSTASGGDTRATAERMLAQLQSMIDSVATQAAPVVRQIGAKAAELA